MLNKKFMQEFEKWLLLLGIAMSLYLVWLAQNNFDLAHQTAIGWGTLFILIVLYKLKIFQLAPWRLIFILLVGYLVIRYVSWRSMQSLIYTGPMDFLGMAILYLAEIYGVVLLFLGMYINLWPQSRSPFFLQEHEDKLPIVDVLIPTYNESEEIIRITAIAATQIDYPRNKLRIFICDDGGTVNKRNTQETMQDAWERYYRLRRLAQDLGINYITRETNRSAKAGNLNHALNHTDGELLLLLDCDHVPTTDILQRTVGYFLADPKLFLVQTPHFFINPTPIEKNLSGIGNPNSENDMFYRSIHPSLDSWNASYFCGSAAVLRRSHLMEVGGISRKTITEDAETSLLIHSKGYNSVYVEQPMVCGLSPENYDDYVLQRTRWAQGMVQMFIMNNPLFTSGLTWPQRLCYFNSCFYWFFGFARFFYFIAPALFLLFGLKIYHTSGWQIIAFVLPYIFAVFLIMDFLYSKARQPFFSELYESIQSVFLIPAVISVIMNPYKPSFKVTPKGKKQHNIFLNPLANMFFIIIIINCIAMIMASIKWFSDPLWRDVILITGIWCTLNLCLAIMSLGAFWERRQIRNFHRINVSDEITISFPRLNYVTTAQLTDISVTGIGFKVKLPCPPSAQEQILIEAPVNNQVDQFFRCEAKIMRTTVPQKGDFYLCGAELILDQKKYREAVRYVYGDSNRWLKLWNTKSESKSTFRMLWFFFLSGLKGIVAHSARLFTQTITAMKLTTTQLKNINNNPK